MDNTTTDDIIELFDHISEKLNQYASIIIFLFGVIGNLLNVMILSNKHFRTNSSGWLFLISSITNLFAIISGITTKILSDWSIDPTATISWLCKLRTFLILVSRTSGSWLIVLAVLDRWLQSFCDHRFHHHRTKRNTQCCCLFVFVVVTLLHLHIFYCYETNLRTTNFKCYYRNNVCLIVTGAIISFIGVIFPIITMSLLSILTLCNIRQFYRRIRPAFVWVDKNDPSHDERRINRKNDRTLLKMLLIQVLLFVLFSLPLVIQTLYTFFRQQSVPHEVAIESLFYNLAFLSAYITNGMPFYIYTFAGGVIFRKALFSLFWKS